MSAYDILDRLRRFGVRSPPTVYRALEDLQRRGLIHRLETLNSFVACRHADEHGDEETHIAQFVLCTACGAAQEVESAPLDKLTQSLSRPFLDHVSKGVFELSGICHACAKGKPRAKAPHAAKAEAR